MSVENGSIRHMVEADIALVYEIERRSFPSPFGEVLIGNIYYSAPELCYVLEYEKQIVGFLLGGYTAIPRQAHILSVAVLEKYRGKGFGRMILEHFLDSIRRLGYNNVKLEVNVSNLKAIKLYEEFGFRIESKIRKYYQDDSDAYLMIRRDTSNNQIL